MSEETDRDDGETPWLREMADEDLLVLFSEDEEQLKRAVRRLIREAKEDADLEERLIELLETAVDEGNDDSSASLMAAIILGEVRSLRAAGVLVRCLAWDADETLQDAAGVALLRIGAPAVTRVMDAVEELETPEMNRAAYALLGQTGILEDPELRRRVLHFLEARVEVERRKRPPESALEELFRSSAQLGDRRQIPVLRSVLTEDFGGRHPGIQDALEMLEENSEGVPFVATQPPWEARYGWLFEEDERETARVRRSRSGQVSITFGGRQVDDRDEELIAEGDGGWGDEREHESEDEDEDDGSKRDGADE